MVGFHVEDNHKLNNENERKKKCIADIYSVIQARERLIFAQAE